jgi:S-(hydroxymethyl)glutathione dehydrogenase/alcohol dehydrogenase
VRAAVLYECPGRLLVEDVTLDAPRAHEVRIRTLAAGLCHSDLHHIDGHAPIPMPVVLGHEGAGVVEAVGVGVTAVKPGDHVITFPLGACGTCVFCLSGRLTLCTQVALLRGPDEEPRLRLASGEPLRQFSGLSAFAEEMLVHENAVVKIRDDMPFDRAALIGCGVTTGLGAALKKAKVEAGSTVAVIGCGGIGLNCVQGAAIAGASRIIAIDTNPGKLERATRFGATDLVDVSAGDALEQVRELLPEHGGVDYSFEAVGSKETYELAFNLLRWGGTATVLGLPPADAKIELTALDLLGERHLQASRMGSVNFREDLPQFVDMYLEGRLELDELVSSRIPLDRINEGFAQIGDGAIARTVVVFD